jgi:hypothetical protein
MTSSSHSRRSSHPAKWARAALPLLAILIVACTSDAVPDSDRTQEASTSQASATATFELGPDTYAFERVTCDLDDQVGDDILARAAGTTPDGRPMRFEVERREVGDLLHDRVTLYFGRMIDGDQWHARASQLPGGGWATTSAGGDPLDGPLIISHDRELAAEGMFTHENREETQPGSLRVTCAGTGE